MCLCVTFTLISDPSMIEQYIHFLEGFLTVF